MILRKFVRLTDKTDSITYTQDSVTGTVFKSMYSNGSGDEFEVNPKDVPLCIEGYVRII